MVVRYHYDHRLMSMIMTVLSIDEGMIGIGLPHLDYRENIFRLNIFSTFLVVVLHG